MAKDTIRRGQLITTFGPGAMLDLPKDAVIVGGLEFWNYDSAEPKPIIEEPRLLARLRTQLDNPPEFLQAPPRERDHGYGFSPNVTIWRFPEWYLVQKPTVGKGGSRKRRLVPKRLVERGRFRADDGKNYTVVPIRFVQSCTKGHVDDIDWIAFVHGRSDDSDAPPCLRPLWLEERGNSHTLADTFITCDCGAERSLSQAARGGLESLGRCKGRRPWLGRASKEACGQPGKLLIRSASNAYFPELIATISIPPTGGELVTLVAKLWEKGLNFVTRGISITDLRSMNPEIGASLNPYSDEQVQKAIATHQAGGVRDEERPIKEVEFAALSTAKDELGVDEPDGDFFARKLDPKIWKDGYPWMDAFERIVLVHRLREVVVQVGFTRFEPALLNLSGELDIDVQRAQLSRSATWLPATENRGEGIFLKFEREKIKEWLKRKSVMERGGVLESGFSEKFSDGDKTRPYYGSPFYMVHSFSHLLMTQIALECGYPSSSLRERIYVEGGEFGLLIYTGSPDAEGTLGGLISAGRQISEIVRRALVSAELCSNDPVCSSQKPNAETQRLLLGAACHGCLLVAETSCEQRNEFLDRTLVVPTLDQRKAAFFTGYGY